MLSSDLFGRTLMPYSAWKPQAFDIFVTFLKLHAPFEEANYVKKNFKAIIAHCKNFRNRYIWNFFICI